ncbi:hypothetical protein [Mesorhizobium sp. LNHC252B00]|uniref:hypothetical protein n=1 Tax=Mesorhizobium sp. LNHC252B00 TaxID=1287252 RepID=UPI0012EB1B3B|nr:hypothetical protein [Mesorhizobium sp. LNHC252B00]
MDQDVQRRLRSQKSADKVHALHRYDGPNAYGTPVHGLSMCEHRSLSASKAGAAWYSVIVDNFTQTGWLREQILKGNVQK